MIIDEDSRDAITELINIGVGKAAGLLNEITQSSIQLQVPVIEVYRLGDLADSGSPILGKDHYASVMQEFRGNFSGVTGLVFPQESALSLVGLLSGDDVDESDLDEVQAETLKEVGNIIINAVMGSIANILAEPLTFSLPVYSEGQLSTLIAGRIRQEKSNPTVVARTRFMIESRQIEGTILLVLEMGSLERLIESIRALDGSQKGADGP